MISMTAKVTNFGMDSGTDVCVNAYIWHTFAHVQQNLFSKL